MIEHDEDLYDFAGVMNFHCNKRSFDTLTEEKFRCPIFISGLQMRLWLPLRTHLLKIMEKNPNVKLQETVRERVKVANLTRNLDLIGSDAKSTRLLHKISASIPQSTKNCGTVEFFCRIDIVFTSSMLPTLAFPSTMSF